MCRSGKRRSKRTDNHLLHDMEVGPPIDIGVTSLSGISITEEGFCFSSPSECVTVRTSSTVVPQDTVIVSFVLRLSPSDGEGSLVPKDGP